MGKLHQFHSFSSSEKTFGHLSLLDYQIHAKPIHQPFISYFFTSLSLKQEILPRREQFMEHHLREQKLLCLPFLYFS
jgi:hypothetical protein